ncbi:SDR family NAD(P)-dependent oxidoreductase [Nocardia uniformis]|uniref:SDR family NAD(P)-dependent oxidoreductase n=1 Tax=Nocardia uniformis TaxID=53432 RepID=A0A849BWB2_9NOCA|nr:SDR family NAD(P)-dependent oxidoreductase [Nocardia uniformis]NNH69276.1 SDR family NAD(P)-dependent oxidoreductase [Nocardia uniformis]
MTETPFAGRTAVITGAAAGIGAALATELAARGMSLVLADIDEVGVRRRAAQLQANGVPALGVGVDVSDPDSVAALAEAAYAKFGSVELLCNNAGVLLFGSVAESSLGDWRWLSSVNVEGTLNCLHAFLPRMRQASGWRYVMNTSSTHAFLPDTANSALYSATKHAVLAITLGLRGELAADGIGVTLLCPGQAATRILDSQRNRPQTFGRRAREPFGTGPIPLAIEPEAVAYAAAEGIRRESPLVFALPDETRAGFRSQIEQMWRLADDALGDRTETRVGAGD